MKCPKCSFDTADIRVGFSGVLVYVCSNSSCLLRWTKNHNHEVSSYYTPTSGGWKDLDEEPLKGRLLVLGEMREE